MKLGNAYYGHSQTNAIFWYRKAARHGNADAQCALGRCLLDQKKDPKGGLKWLLLAANQNQARAQVEIGNLYNKGVRLKEDKVEAYKWYCIAWKQQDIGGPVNGDALALAMTREQIDDAQKRADAVVSVASQVVLPELQLTGISGSSGKRLAIINGHAFAAGETVKVKDEEEVISVTCLEIQADVVKIEVAGEAEPRVFKLSL